MSAGRPLRIGILGQALVPLALGTIIESESLELWPGYRSDVLVEAPTTQGEYFLIDDIAPAATTMSGQDKELNYVARIIVEGDGLRVTAPKRQL